MAELTPEEKKKIQEEEKARIEAQEKAKKELKAKQTKKGCLGCLIVFIVVFVIVYAIVMKDVQKKKKEVKIPKKPTPTTEVLVDISGKYKVTKYKYKDLGHSWTMVLVDKDVTQKEAEAMYRQLRKDYPQEFFDLVIGEDNLVKLYKYTLKRIKDPTYRGSDEIEKILNNYDLGIIRTTRDKNMRWKWEFFKMGGFYKLKKE